MNYRIRKFTESLETDKFAEVIEEVKSLIKTTIEKAGGEEKEFIESFIKNPTEVKIEGLINDSDIYDFYLKYRNQIDECLNDINFYDIAPSENNVIGLYDFTIKGSMIAVQEFVKKLSN